MNKTALTITISLMAHSAPLAGQYASTPVSTACEIQYFQEAPDAELPKVCKERFERDHKRFFPTGIAEEQEDNFLELVTSFLATVADALEWNESGSSGTQVLAKIYQIASLTDTPNSDLLGEYLLAVERVLTQEKPAIAMEGFLNKTNSVSLYNKDHLGKLSEILNQYIMEK